MVLKTTGLQLYLATYSRKNKHQDGYTIKKRSSQYQGRQQGCSDAKRRTINKKNDS